MTSRQERKRSNERLRHAGWAGLIALVMWLLSVFSPIDQLIWMVQAKLANFEASGEIVFVGVERDPTDPAFPTRREELARAIASLQRAGAESLYVDLAFDQPSSKASDRALNEALRTFGKQAYLIRNLKTGLAADNDIIEHTTEAVGQGIRQVGGKRAFNILGIVWEMPRIVEQGDTALVSAPVSMAGIATDVGRHFPINYGFEVSSIPSTRLSKILQTPPDELAARFAGKTIILGHLGPESEFDIPGTIGIPGSIVYIYAAESLKAGYLETLPAIAVLIAGMAALLGASLTRQAVARRLLYACVSLSAPICFIVTTQLGIRPHLGDALALLLIYGAFRLRSKWKKQILLVDHETNLPSFAALEADRQVARDHPTIIVAKMHRFEEVRQTLPANLHSEYVLRIIDRLNAAAPDTTIYVGPGHAIAWHMAETDPTLVKDHLEGLRALFASPLQVGGEQVDVGITFGVDISPSRDVTRRLANAVAAAERTTETYLPILVAETKSEEELIWNISLQARIDAALENNEIFLAYQPKIRVDTGEMVGMEALVRWRDPVRGLIPPDSFIKQCEETGRMGHLTRHVLRAACRAGAELARQGAAPSIAVNISATLLHDRAIMTMIREVVAETGIEPRKLALEITETSRISDMDMARTNLQEMAAMGMIVSMDDFGVGSASFEALLRLPFSELKIDRIFIDPLGKDPKAMGIVRSMLELGRNLRLAVVAEGVEDQATLDLLRHAACPLAQGFGICRPVSLQEAVLFQDRSRKLKMA